MKYKIIVSAFKASGKFYSSGSPIQLGDYSEYPASLVFQKCEEISKNLDAFAGLTVGSVKQNNFTVLIQVLDDTTEDPIWYQALYNSRGNINEN